MKLSNMDLVAIQECLESYRVLLNWIPVESEEDVDLKAERLRLIKYLQNKCEEGIRR